MKKRVVITGLGIVSPFGNDVDTFYQKLLQGESAISLISNFSTEDLPAKIAGEIKAFDSEGYIDKKTERRIDPFIKYATVAGYKALESADVKVDSLDKHRAGIIIGSGMGGMSVFVDGVNTLYNKGSKRVTPFFVPYILTNMAGALLGIDLGFMGPNYSVSTACATGNNAIIAAAEYIRNGQTDLMLCGGTEAAIIPMGVAGFCACRALSCRNDEPEKASRPFDRDRNGFVMGEGAGVLVLESLEHAQKRGATILAEYLGGGVSCDAHHMTEPRPDGQGIINCLNKALKDAAVESSQIDYINAHATSTQAGDMVEVNAVKQVVQASGQAVMNSTKSIIGHGLGAAGGIEAVVTVKAIMEQKIHPTLNLENPEPGLEHFIVPTRAISHKIDVALSNSFGFGGHNASILFGKIK
ncbi:MAG: beta-ketoacyl-ACP synthase II [Waddliaceae bacterium]